MKGRPAPGSQGILEEYESRRVRGLILILGSFALTVLLAVVFAALGTTDTTPADIARALLALFSAQEPDTQQKVILHLRLPRVAMAILAGVGLSISGAAMQGIT